MSARNTLQAKRFRRADREIHWALVAQAHAEQAVWRWSRLAAALAGHAVFPDPPTRLVRRGRVTHPRRRYP